MHGNSNAPITTVPRPVDEMMRRVHAELEAGAAPSFEALLAKVPVRSTAPREPASAAAPR